MSFLHRLSRLFLTALLLSLGLYLASVAISSERWDTLVTLISGGRSMGFWSGVALVCLCVIFMFSGLPRKRNERFLSFDNDGGSVSISTEAIADYISRLMPEFPSITRLNTHVLPQRNTVNLLLTVCVRSGSQVNEVCQLLQERVRDTMSSGLGITQVGKVEVSVREIVSEHRIR